MSREKVATGSTQHQFLFVQAERREPGAIA